MKKNLLADKGYDSEEIRRKARSKDMNPIIPRRSNSKKPNLEFDKHLYKARHQVENIFARLKYQEKFIISYTGETAFIQLSEQNNLNEVFCIKELRTVNKDHTFKKDGTRYQIKNLTCSLAKRTIEVRTYINGDVEYYFFDRELDVEEYVDYLEIA